jgi:hypothetical protein
LGCGSAPGARKSTCEAFPFVTVWQGFEAKTQICPTEVFPPATPFTLHATLVFELPVTCTVKVAR